ncbi:MAG: hypothetical protein ACOCSH_01320 [Candidatus Hadarchaeota archaeon]
MISEFFVEVISLIRSDGMDTTEVLREVRNFVEDTEVEDVVVASTSGETGLEAAKSLDGLDVNLVVVGHCTGFDEENEQEMSDERRGRIEELGGKVLIGTMVSHNINIAIKERAGFSTHEMFSNMLRLFGQGTKVALEDVLMACDAGLVDSGKDVVSVAGTGSGADTALLVRSANSMNLFDSRIKEVILKPAKVKNLPFY